MTHEHCNHCGRPVESSGVYYSQRSRICRRCYEALGSRRKRLPWIGAACCVLLIAVFYHSSLLWPVMDSLAAIVDSISALLVVVLILGVSCWVEMVTRSGTHG